MPANDGARRNADAKSRTNPPRQNATRDRNATRRRVGIDLPRSIDRIGAPLLRFVCGVCGAAVGRAAQRLGRVEAPRAEERWPADAVNKGTDNRSKGTDSPSKGTDSRSKGTDNRSKGTDIRSKGTDSRSKGTDSRSKGTDNRSHSTDSRSKGTNNRSKGTDSRSKGTDNRSKGTDNRSNRTIGTEHPRHHKRRSGVRLGVRSASSSPALLPKSEGNRKIKPLPPLRN